MDDDLEINKISKKDFLKIKEKDVMFITNPGRMGDEDGITFIVKHDNKFTIYRIDGWMYPSRDLDKNNFISLNDAKNQFPKWFEAWKNKNDKKYKGKYKYLYMGFGNGLCVDNSIYKVFKSHLDDKVNEYLNGNKDDENSNYSIIFIVWMSAFKKMLNKNKKSDKI